MSNQYHYEEWYSYFGARYYDPNLSIWLSVDPLSDKYSSLSAYAYTANNPLNIIDPDGNYLFGLFGSTKEQRQAASEFQSSNGGTINNLGRRDVSVDYTFCRRSIDSKSGWVDEVVGASQSFNRDGTLVSPNGQLGKTTGIQAAESWMNSPSESFGTASLKVAANVGYSIVNSPKVLLTGKSWAGSEANFSEKMDAFIDVGPSLLSMGLSQTNEIVRTVRGLEGYNKFVKKFPGATISDGLPNGMKWQTRAGSLFQTNKIDQAALKESGNARLILDINKAGKDQ
jgi:RHS repeat-associated protein